MDWTTEEEGEAFDASGLRSEPCILYRTRTERGRHRSDARDERRCGIILMMTRLAPWRRLSTWSVLQCPFSSGTDALSA